MGETGGNCPGEFQAALIGARGQEVWETSGYTCSSVSPGLWDQEDDGLGMVTCLVVA